MPPSTVGRVPETDPESSTPHPIDDRASRTQKREFISAVGQHLEGPLAALIGLTDLLQDRDSSAGVRNQLIERVGHQAEELSELLADFQTLARVDLGEVPLRREPIDLRTLLDQVASDWWGQKQKRFMVSGDGVAIADRASVTQILENLLRHAAGGEGTYVAMRIGDGPKRTVVEIADDGPALDSESVERAFESGYGQTTGGQSPLALALAVAHRLARINGGALSYRYQSGENIFELRLPAAPGVSPQPHPDETVVDPLAGHPSGDALEELVADGGPDMVYQPIVDIRAHQDGETRVIGYESLARFPSSTPPEWFDLADRHGVRLDLELSAIQAAVAGFDARIDTGFLSLNLSDQTLISPKLVTLLERTDPGRIVLELSEVAAIKSYGTTSRAMQRLRERGVRLAVDDVGVGEIDLWHILRLEPEIVKIDTCLVRGIEHHPRHAALVRGIAAMCADLGILVVAESVESIPERDVLGELGVEFAQGYLFGKPGPLRWHSKVLSSEPVLRGT